MDEKNEHEQVEDLDVPESEADDVKGGSYDLKKVEGTGAGSDADASIRNAWPKKYTY